MSQCVVALVRGFEQAAVFFFQFFDNAQLAAYVTAYGGFLYVVTQMYGLEKFVEKEAEVVVVECLGSGMVAPVGLGLLQGLFDEGGIVEVVAEP